MIILINNSKTRVGTQRAMKKIIPKRVQGKIWNKMNKNSIKVIDNAFIYINIHKKEEKIYEFWQKKTSHTERRALTVCTIWFHV